MQRNKLTVLGQGLAACALWVCGLAMLQSAAPAQASQDTMADKTSKAKKSKKSDAGVTSQPATSGAPVEKAPASGNSKNSANRAQTEKETAPPPVRNASGADIKSAKTGGKVWVNTDSGVYHKGGQWYGATKQGKFMTEQDAIKAGYKPAKNEK
jgi:hypothetical protein